MSVLDGSYVFDPARLFALDQLELLDSPPEPSYDRLTALVSKLLNTPVSLVSLVAADRQFFKSQVGLAEPWATVRETPLSHSFCQYVVAEQAPLVIEDARVHPLVADNLAIPDLGVVAYVGVPIYAPSGETLGAFCAIDTAPRVWTEAELAILEDVSRAVMTEIELRDKIRRLQESEASHAELQDELFLAHKAVLDELSVPIVQISEELVVVPVRGRLDEYRVQQIQDALTRLVSAAPHTALIVDLTGVSLVTAPLAEALAKINAACVVADVAFIVAGLPAEGQCVLGTHEPDLKRVGMFASLPEAVAVVNEQQVSNAG